MTRVMIFGLLLSLALGLSCRTRINVDGDVDVDPAAATVDDDGLYDRALARIGDIDRGVPRVEDGFVWWGDRSVDEAAVVDGRTAHCRRGLEPGDPTEVVLDERAEVSSDEGFVDVGSLSASPDGNSVAFAADTTRNDRYGVSVKNLKSGKIRRVVDDADFSVSWSKDGNLWFTRFGSDDRPRSLWRVRPDESDAPMLVHELTPSDPGELLVADVDDTTELFVRRDGEVDHVRLSDGTADGGDHGGNVHNRSRSPRPAMR